LIIKLQILKKKNFKDLNLFVKEQPTGSISAGIGYGTNGGLLEASINERNFLGQGINLNLTGSFSSEKISGIFSYLNPNFQNSNKELATSLFSEVDDYTNSGYQNKRVGTRPIVFQRNTFARFFRFINSKLRDSHT
jgi:outer membrane protein insertion porin family